MADAASATPALLTAGGALAVALVSAFAAYRAQQRAFANQAELQRHQKDLKRLQDELDEKRAERSARRDYEYEALKRLYQECSPLVFVLTEQASAAFGRIQGLAQTAAQGNLSGPNSWLAAKRHSYYRLSTEYRLLAPLATLKLLQQRLTQFDLSLEPHIRLVYGLARQAGRAIGDDFDLARSGANPLAYDPHSDRAAELLPTQAAVYWQQGVPRGILDNAVESLLVREDGGSPRVMSYMEFESRRVSPGEPSKRAFDRIEYLLVDFHPRTRPVLWRVLLATASVYRSLMLATERAPLGAASIGADQLLTPLEADRASFDWRADKDDIESGVAIAQAHDAVAHYLRHSLGEAIQRDLSAIAQATRPGQTHH